MIHPSPSFHPIPIVPDILDRSAAAAGEALREVAWDRERGLPHSTPEMLRKVAGAVLTAAEAYGVRRCRTCAHWERAGIEDWGVCRLASEPNAQEPLRFYVVGESVAAMTHEAHGCRCWLSAIGYQLSARGS